MREGPEPSGPWDIKLERTVEVFTVQKIREGICGEGSLFTTNWSLSEYCCSVQTVMSPPQINNITKTWRQEESKLEKLRHRKNSPWPRRWNEVTISMKNGPHHFSKFPICKVLPWRGPSKTVLDHRMLEDAETGHRAPIQHPRSQGKPEMWGQQLRNASPGGKKGLCG